MSLVLQFQTATVTQPSVSQINSLIKVLMSFIRHKNALNGFCKVGDITVIIQKYAIIMYLFVEMQNINVITDSFNISFSYFKNYYL